MILEDRAAFESALPIAALPPVSAHAPAPAELLLIRAQALSDADHACWDRLGEDAATPSIFAQPWFTRAGLAHCAEGSRCTLAVVRDETGEWLGAMPLIARLCYGRAPFPHWAQWTHPNQFRGTPLVRNGQAVRFWRGLFDGLDRKGRGRLALRLTGLPLGEDVALALMQVCCEDRRAWKVDRQHTRAVLHADQPESPEALKGSRRRRIASLERKLAREIGPQGWRVVRDEAAVAPALARFLALERAGWKGAAGSALASAASTSGFFAAVTAEAARRGRLEITELLAGDRVIASSVHFIGDTESYGYKMAYDEALGAYGPGLLLLARLTAHFRETGPARIDSCCAPGQEPIGTLWPDRLGLVDCGVALGGEWRRRGLNLLNLAETIYHGAPG